MGSRPVTGRSEVPFALDEEAEGQLPELPELSQSQPLPPIWEGVSAQTKPKSTPFPGPRHGVHFAWKIPYHTVSKWATDGKTFADPLPPGTNINAPSWP